MFAFRELSRLRARVDVNLLVLDEVLNHLDGPGRIRVGRALRALLQQHRYVKGLARESGSFQTRATRATARVKLGRRLGE